MDDPGERAHTGADGAPGRPRAASLARLPAGHPLRDEILARHDAAVTAGEVGYADPATGLFVLTATYLVARGTCCGSGCRHCPYVP